VAETDGGRISEPGGVHHQFDLVLILGLFSMADTGFRAIGLGPGPAPFALTSEREYWSDIREEAGANSISQHPVATILGIQYSLGTVEVRSICLGCLGGLVSRVMGVEKRHGRRTQRLRAYLRRARSLYRHDESRGVWGRTWRVW